MPPLDKVLYRIARLFGYHLEKYPPEGSVFRQLLELFKKYQIDCVLDVGANHGGYALMLRDIGFQDKIVSFEPIPDSFQRLLKNAENDKFWSSHNFALGSVEGKKEMNVTGGRHFSSFYKPNHFAADQFGNAARVSHTQEVSIRRLDKVLDEIIPKLNVSSIFLKVDTQGFEMEVLRGAGEWLKKIPVIQTEVSLQTLYENKCDFTESLRELTQLGYDISGLFPVVQDSEMRLLEMDCILVRRK